MFNSAKAITLGIIMVMSSTILTEVIEITSVQQFEAFLQIKDALIFIDFYAPKCDPCKAYAKTITQVSAMYPGVLFLKVNAEKLSTLGNRYKVESVPRTILFKNNKKVHDFVGTLNKKQVCDIIKKYE